MRKNLLLFFLGFSTLLVEVKAQAQSVNDYNNCMAFLYQKEWKLLAKEKNVEALWLCNIKQLQSDSIEMIVSYAYPNESLYVESQSNDSKKELFLFFELEGGKSIYSKSTLSSKDISVLNYAENQRDYIVRIKKEEFMAFEHQKLLKVSFSNYNSINMPFFSLDIPSKENLLRHHNQLRRVIRKCTALNH